VGVRAHAQFALGNVGFALFARRTATFGPLLYVQRVYTDSIEYSIETIAKKIVAIENSIDEMMIAKGWESIHEMVASPTNLFPLYLTSMV
jgi:hypothetical protein